jgi:hypothetical protein
MPSTSAKQHRFMEAIAHNRAFAKKVGIPQSVGKEFVAADKGKKFVRGGINKQDTRHGKMDMPFNKLNRFAGMKSGGMMKKGRRYDEGGDVPNRVYAEDAGITGRGDEKVEDQYRDSTGEGADTYAEPQKSVKTKSAPNEGPQKKQSFAEAFKEASKTPGSVFTWNGKKYSTEMAKPAAKTATKSAEASSKPAEARATPSNVTDSGAVSGMTRRGQTVRRPAASEAAPEAQPKRSTMQSLDDSMRQTFSRDISKWNRFAKGGMMKESKAMVGKEVAFMKKKGAPASMIKHEQAEMKMARGGAMRPKKDIEADQMKMAMKKGGVKYARGGGIESRGKTKGTIVKMAAGGLASGHKAADGIAQRGKTKGMKVAMKGGGYC